MLVHMICKGNNKGKLSSNKAVKSWSLEHLHAHDKTILTRTFQTKYFSTSAFCETGWYCLAENMSFKVFMPPLPIGYRINIPTRITSLLKSGPNSSGQAANTINIKPGRLNRTMRMRIVLKSPNKPSARRAVKKGVMYYNVKCNFVHMICTKSL